MADWNKPTTTSDYLAFVAEMNAKFVDTATQFGVQAAQNYPVGTMRFNRSLNYFDEFDGATFQPKVISLQGGGTGANNAAQARVNLGIGSMGTQNSNAVNITGGSITGVKYSANDINSGILALALGGTGYANSLTAYGTTFICDGSRVILASGQYLSELNASALVIGTVPAARLSGVATLAGPNNFTGANQFTGGVGPGGPLFVSGDSPAIQFYHSPGAGDLKYNRIIGANGGLYFQRVNDAYSVAYNLLVIDSNGYMTGIGVGLTNLNGSNIDRGRVAPQFLGGGTPNAGNFLRGDGNWVDMSSGGTGGGIPAGMIGIFYIDCPPGWTRVPALDGRFPLGSTGYGTFGGSNTHSHPFGANTSNAGGHDHDFSGSGSTPAANTNSPINEGGQGATFNGSNSSFAPYYHSHHIDPMSVSISGRTGGVGDHSHQLNGQTGDSSFLPPYVTVVFCAK
jgi:hypothetical protein